MSPTEYPTDAQAALNRIGCGLFLLFPPLTTIATTVYLAYLYGWGSR